MKPIKKTIAVLSITALALTAIPFAAYANSNRHYGGIDYDYNVYEHNGSIQTIALANSTANNSIDAETAKKNYLAGMEAEKDYVKSLLDNEVITQEQYDLAIDNIQSAIDYVNENGLTNSYGRFGGHFGGGHGGRHHFGGNFGYYNNAVDAETAKENYLAAMEAEKDYAKTMLDNGTITQKRYDLIITNIQTAIDYVNENGLTSNYGRFGGHHW